MGSGGHLQGVQVELHMDGLACGTHAIETAGLLQAPVVHLAAQSRPRVLRLPQQHLWGKSVADSLLSVSTWHVCDRLHPHRVQSLLADAVQPSFDCFQHHVCMICAGVGTRLARNGCTD